MDEKRRILFFYSGVIRNIPLNVLTRIGTREIPIPSLTFEAKD